MLKVLKYNSSVESMFITGITAGKEPSSRISSYVYGFGPPTGIGLPTGIDKHFENNYSSEKQPFLHPYSVRTNEISQSIYKRLIKTRKDLRDRLVKIGYDNETVLVKLSTICRLWCQSILSFQNIVLV